ncbi:MAG TPA: septum formation initiator family protein [Candidatus Binatia bacterium]|nr:septum formation initiator family protein [Candidatus Binatia bacterium]
MPAFKISQLRFFIWGFVLLLITLSLFSIFADRGAIHLWRLQEEKKRLDERNFALQKENEGLRDRIHRLRHDDLYLEQVAREELGLVRPGEVIYRFGSSQSRPDRTKPLSEIPSQPSRSSGQKPRR